jgi:hypothetical protein
MSLQTMLRVANTLDLTVEELLQDIKRRKGPALAPTATIGNTLRRRVRSAEFHWTVGHLSANPRRMTDSWAVSRLPHT